MTYFYHINPPLLSFPIEYNVNEKYFLQVEALDTWFSQQMAVFWMTAES